MAFTRGLFISLLLLALVCQPLAYAEPTGCNGESEPMVSTDYQGHAMHGKNDTGHGKHQSGTFSHSDNCCDQECDTQCSVHHIPQLSVNPFTTDFFLPVVNYSSVSETLVFQGPDPLLRPPISR